MKNYILIIVSVVLLGFSVQQAQAQRVKLGVEAGINISNANITPTPTTSSDSKTGLLVGAVVDINVSKTISVVSGVRYNMRGFKFVQGAASADYKLNFLEFPALLKVKFPLTEVKPYLIGGPTLGINMASTLDQTDGVNTTSTDVKANFTSTDFGLLFGAGLDFSVATKTDLFIQFGYSLGLSDNYNVAGSTTTVKNYGIEITGGAKFGL